MREWSRSRLTHQQLPTCQATTCAAKHSTQAANRTVSTEPRLPVNWSQSTWPRANHPIVFDNDSTLNNPFEARTATEHALPAVIELAAAIGWVPSPHRPSPPAW